MGPRGEQTRLPLLAIGPRGRVLCTEVRHVDERTAEQLAVVVGGEAWQSGGGIYLVTVTREDGSLCQ